ncbi:glycosyltransferase [Puniceicoccus vermicola]|uniref:Glycosyltransferase family 2 protein n=1 Tax=Puniceicoccus vermicola TaxID=388746 RepID=A0A7X1E501_9BACT|nr:glycosyltransferase family 2 protein [Puniceicoccus vermicola]
MSEISIIIPCFNHGQYLEEAVESVRQQLVPVEEIVIVDDGSDDPETLRVLEKVAKIDRVTVLSQENAGPAAARNLAIREVRTPFVASLDADDRLLPDFVEKLLPKIKADEKVGVAYGQARSFGVGGTARSPQPYRFPEVLLDPCIYSTAIFRKSDWEAVGGFCEDMRSGWEDFEFWISIIETGREVSYLDAPVFEYRRHQSSRDVNFSASRMKVLEAFETIFQKHPKIYSDHIRLLFEAHMERLDWRSRFQGKVQPELRFSQNGSARVLSPEDVRVSGRRGIAQFRLDEVLMDDREFRFHPFGGPGEFQLISLKVLDAQGAIHQEIAPEECPMVDYSFGRKLSEGDNFWPAVFFLVSGPQAGFRLDERISLFDGCQLEIKFRLQQGDVGATLFLEHLSAYERDFNDSAAKIRSLGLELAHVKQELEKEMKMRRKVQGSRGYRWTRPFARLFSPNRSSGGKR